LKSYNDFKIGYNDEYNINISDINNHITCLATSNKGNYIVLGYSNGTIQRRNIK